MQTCRQIISVGTSTYPTHKYRHADIISVVTSKYCAQKYTHADILFLSSPASFVQSNTHMQTSFLSSPASIVYRNTHKKTYYFCRHQQVLCTEIHACRHSISVVTSKQTTHKYRYADISFVSSRVSIVQRNTHMQTLYFCRHHQVLYA